MSRLLPLSLVGFVLGVVVTGLLALWVLSGRLDQGLHHPLERVRSAESPPSRLHDADGDVLMDFRLVQPVEVEAPEAPPLLIEAFLVASPSAFYEPRARAATSRSLALHGALQGRAPTASPLSVELARVLLVSEPAGLQRRVREELLATRLDAETTVSERAAAWLDWVPLCHGRRGASAARRDCLGVDTGEWSAAEAASVAVAAARDLDLADDSDLLGAARDAVLERLVRRGLAGREAFAQRVATTGREPVDPCLEEVRSEVRRRVGEAWGQVLGVETQRDILLSDALERLAPDGRWLLASDDGSVIACRGAGSTGLRQAVRPPQPGDGVEQVAAWALAVSSAGRPAGARWTGSVRIGSRELPPHRPVARPPAMSPERAYGELLGLEPAERGMRTRAYGSVVAVIHPRMSGAVQLDDPGQAEELAARLSHRVTERRFPVPDGVEVVSVEGRLAVRMRDGGPLPR